MWIACMAKSSLRTRFWEASFEDMLLTLRLREWAIIDDTMIQMQIRENSNEQNSVNLNSWSMCLESRRREGNQAIHSWLETKLRELMKWTTTIGSNLIGNHYNLLQTMARHYPFSKSYYALNHPHCVAKKNSVTPIAWWVCAKIHRRLALPPFPPCLPLMPTHMRASTWHWHRQICPAGWTVPIVPSLHPPRRTSSSTRCAIIVILIVINNFFLVLTTQTRRILC